MKKLITGLLLTSVVATSQLSAIENNFIMDIMPLSIVAHSDLEGFSNTSGFSSETISGSASVSPNILLGYGLDLSYFSFDVTAGGGALVNGAFSATYLQGEVCAYVTTKQKGFMIGPFYRIMDYSDPKWLTDNLIMTGTQASVYGISMMTGGKKVKFKMKVGQTSGADIAVQGINGYTASSNTLSLDGLNVELGLALRF